MSEQDEQYAKQLQAESTEAQQPSAAIVPVEGGNLELSAQSPDEIVQCHSAMVRWCENKMNVINGEANELEAAYLHAKKCKWRYDVLEKQWKMMIKRVEFYEKMLVALKAGYHVIPVLPVELFAIRTDRTKPKAKWKVLKFEHHGNFEQKAKTLPVGEGEYENPQPVVTQGRQDYKTVEYGKEVIKHGFEATDWAEMEFPANMARVHVMEATTRAMAIKAFDDIGMLPADYKRNPDPMIIGRIHDPRKIYGNPRTTVHFLIAWHIDTRGL